MTDEPFVDWIIDACRDHAALLFIWHYPDDSGQAVLMPYAIYRWLNTRPLVN